MVQPDKTKLCSRERERRTESEGGMGFSGSDPFSLFSVLCDGTLNESKPALRGG